MAESKIIDDSDVEKYMYIDALMAESARLEKEFPFKTQYRLVDFRGEDAAKRIFRETAEKSASWKRTLELLGKRENQHDVYITSQRIMHFVKSKNSYVHKHILQTYDDLKKKHHSSVHVDNHDLAVENCIKDMHNVIASLQESRHGIMEDLSNTKEELAVTKQRMDELNSELVKKENEKKSKDDDMNRLLQASRGNLHDDEIRRLKETIAELETQVKELKEDIGRKSKKIKNLQQQMKEKTKHLELHDSLKTKTAELELLSKRESEKDKRLHQLQKENQKLAEEKRELERELTACDTEVTSVKEQFEILKKELKEETERKSKQVDSLQQENKKLIEEKRELERQLSLIDFEDASIKAHFQNFKHSLAKK